MNCFDSHSPIFWWHSIDLGDRVTPGCKSEEALQLEWHNLNLPELRDSTVLDIGAWDGWFSFKSEREGAARVVALDHYAWSMDLLAQQEYIAQSRDKGEAMIPYHDNPRIWRPNELPGKAGFDLVRSRLGSSVEAVVADFMTTDLTTLGTFDIVLYLGILYHMEEPLTALRRLRVVTGRLAVIESQACTPPGGREGGWLRFHPSWDLNNDPTNWYVPCEEGLHALCRAAGFQTITTVAGSPPADGGDYRIVVHATVD